MNEVIYYSCWGMLGIIITMALMFFVGWYQKEPISYKTSTNVFEKYIILLPMFYGYKWTTKNN